MDYEWGFGMVFPEGQDRGSNGYRKWCTLPRKKPTVEKYWVGGKIKIPSNVITLISYP